MAVSTYAELSAHYGHKIEIANYADRNVAVECVDCYEVLVDFDSEEN